MTITTDDLVRREVFYCVSSLVHTLATSYGAGTSLDALDALTEQAFELSAPLLDYEEAARDEGWTTYDDGFRHEDGEIEDCADDWQELCDLHRIEPFEREVFEHWIVSDWLADKLEAKGEKVDRDFSGMTIWARTTTGQAIAMDYVIEQIAADLNKPEPECIDDGAGRAVRNA